jgi:hypothetical protein
MSFINIPLKQNGMENAREGWENYNIIKLFPWYDVHKKNS